MLGPRFRLLAIARSRAQHRHVPLGLTRSAAATLLAVAGSVLASACTMTSGGADRGASTVGEATAIQAASWPPVAFCPEVRLGATASMVRHDAQSCPLALPLGRNQATLIGIDLERAVSFDIPEVGWRAHAAGLGGFELTGPRGEVVTVFPYPLMSGLAAEPVGGTQLLASLRARPDVRILDAGPWQAGRHAGGVWMDLSTQSEAATATTECRLEAPCLPLLIPLLDWVSTVEPPSSSPVVELRPGVVSRLLIEPSAETRLQAAVWVHESPPSDSPAEHVVASLRFGDARERAGGQ